jgi:hypothetical protein
MNLEQTTTRWAKSHPMVIDTAAAGLVLFLTTVDVANGGFEA